jgi:hypothetical protein
MRLATPVAFLVALALLLGCGGSSDQTTSGPGERGGVAQRVQAAWERNPSCKPPQGASRWGCSVGPYRCQGVVVGRGWSVSCSKPDKSIAFLIPRD